MGHPWPLFHLFSSLQKTLQFLQQINVKNIHPVYGAKIQTQDLWNMSLLPLPLDQGSRPKVNFLLTQSQNKHKYYKAIR